MSSKALRLCGEALSKKKEASTLVERIDYAYNNCKIHVAGMNDCFIFS